MQTLSWTSYFHDLTPVTSTGRSFKEYPFLGQIPLNNPKGIHLITGHYPTAWIRSTRLHHIDKRYNVLVQLRGQATEQHLPGTTTGAPSTMQSIDTLISGRWVIPIEPDDRVHENYSIAIDEGRIMELLPRAEARAKYQAEVHHDLDEHLLMPGMVNAHTHAAMSLMRGVADDLPLMTWLKEHIWPIESTCVSREFVRDGTELALAEMLLGGTTCFSDMYFYPDEVARQAEHHGIRAVVGLIVIEFPSVWASDADDYIAKGLAVHDSVRGYNLVTTTLAPHAPYTISDKTFEKIAMYAEELDVPVHLHVHETTDEVEESLSQYRMRPLARLEKLGLLSPRLLAVHMAQLTEDEIMLFATSNGHVLHCPESNLKLGNGFCPVKKLSDAGTNIALGTDGAASNNNLDMFGEMRTAALLAKGVAGDASALPAYEALRMATINGAKALNLDHEIGSLEVGKSADIIALHMNRIEMQPIFNPLSHLVYATGHDQVSEVWVAGRHLLHHRRLTTIDDEALLRKVSKWRDKIGACNSPTTPEKPQP